MGRPFRQKYKRRDGSTGVNRKWYGEYRDESGKTRRVPLSTDRQESNALLRELELGAERRRAGLVDPFADTKQAAIEGLVADYLADMRLRNRSDRHIADTRRLINVVIHTCGFDKLLYLNRNSLDKYLASLTCSARTKNSHRQAVVGFANWLVKKRKLPYNPLANSTKAEGETVLNATPLALTNGRPVRFVPSA